MTKVTWSRADVFFLTKAVEASMEHNGYVDFNDIAAIIRKNAGSCRCKAYALGLVFDTRPPPDEECKKPKHDMIDLPYHAAGGYIDYIQCRPVFRRIDYPAMWEKQRNE